MIDQSVYGPHYESSLNNSMDDHVKDHPSRNSRQTKPINLTLPTEILFGSVTLSNSFEVASPF